MYIYCNGPEEIFKSPTLANISWRSSGGSPIPVTSPLMPPKPARKGRKRYSWQNPSKKDVCMHIRIFNPWEFRKEKKEVTFKSQGSINCPYKTDDVVASSNNDVTRKAVCETAVLSVEGISRFVARKRFLPTKHSALSLIDNFRKRWMACKGLVSLIIICLIMILGMLGGLTKIIRCERKSAVGNSMEFGSSEKLRNVGAPFPFTIFHECLNTVLGFQRKLWHCGMIYLLWERNKLGTRERKKLWSFGSRPILAKKKLRNLRLGNIFKETFGL